MNNPTSVSSTDKKTERRRFPRYLGSTKIHFHLKGDKPDSWNSAHTKDISANGIAFVRREFLPLSSELEIIIPLPKDNKELHLDGKIVRQEDLGARGYLFGVEFIDPSPELQHVIKEKIEMKDLSKLLKVVADNKASDLHLCVKTPPLVRIGGRLKPLNSTPTTKEDLKDMIYSILTEEQIDKLLEEFELDSSYELTTGERFRFNIHFQRGNIEATFRRIYTEHKDIKSLGLPEIVTKMALSNSGLIVITGKTNNGKTTTAAAMINLINETKDSVIVTVEEPIEHLHENKKSVIKQREVGLDTKSFHVAAREALRQDIDVILVGEILDPETLLVALRAAEVGHLVILTFPAHDCTQAVERMIFSAPPHLQYQVRMQLSNTLLGILAQKLCPALDDPEKRIISTEILVNTPAISNGIREANFPAIRTAIQTGAQVGMHTMKASLQELSDKKFISSKSIEEFEAEERNKLV